MIKYKKYSNCKDPFINQYSEIVTCGFEQYYLFLCCFLLEQFDGNKP